MRVRRLNSFLYGHIWHYFCVPDFQVQNGCMELLWFSLSHFGQTLSKRPSLNSLITLLKRCVSQKQPKDCELSCWPMKATHCSKFWAALSTIAAISLKKRPFWYRKYAQNLLQCVTALQQSLRMLEHFLELWPKLRLIRNRPFLNIHTLRLCKTLWLKVPEGFQM